MRLPIRNIVAKGLFPWAILFVAAVLRLYRFSEHVMFLGDQGRDAIIIKRILTLEHFPAIGAPTSIGQVYLGPFYYYFISPFLWLWNFNPVGLAFGTALVMLTGMAAAYFVIKKEMNGTAAALFLLMAVFSSVNIEASRFSWNPNLLPVFMFAALYFFYLSINSKRLVYPLVLGALLSFSLQLHYLAVFVFLAIVPFSLYFFLKHQNRVLCLKKIGLAVLSFAFFSLPLLVFDLRHGFLNTNNFLKMFSEGGVVAGGSYPQRLTETVTGFFRHALAVDMPPAVALLLFAFILMMGTVIGLRTRNLFHILLMAFFPVYIMGFAFLGSPRHAHYYGPLYFGFYAALSYIFAVRAEKCRICRLVVVVLMLGYVLANAAEFKFFFGPGNRQVDRARKVAAAVEREVEKMPFQTVALPENETDHAYRYFLEIGGKPPLPDNSVERAEELFVLCFTKECEVLNHPQWQIAAFENQEVGKIWSTEGIRIYKLVHSK